MTRGVYRGIPIHNAAVAPPGYVLLGTVAYPIGWGARPQPRRRAPSPRRKLSKSLRGAIFIRDGRSCRRCSSTTVLQIDHVRPVIRGGTNDPVNLQVLCATCNARKGARVEEPCPESAR